MTIGVISFVLLITLIACSETEPDYPNGEVLQGRFALTKAVIHELEDVGGPHLNDPIINRRVRHTYHYQEGVGCLDLGKGSFYLNAPLPVHPLEYKGEFKAVEEMYRRWGDDLPGLYYKEIDDDALTTKLLIDVHYETGGVAHAYGKYPYEWIGDTLKLDFWRLWNPVYIYELYWIRDNYTNCDSP